MQRNMQMISALNVGVCDTRGQGKQLQHHGRPVSVWLLSRFVDSAEHSKCHFSTGDDDTNDDDGGRDQSKLLNMWYVDVLMQRWFTKHVLPVVI